MKFLKKILFLFCLCMLPVRSFCACSAVGYYLKLTSPDATGLRCANNEACTKTCSNDPNSSCNSDDDCGEQGTCSDSCGDGTCELRSICSDNNLATQNEYGEYFCSTCEVCPIGYSCDNGEKTPCNPFEGKYSSNQGSYRCSSCRNGLVNFTADVDDDYTTITVVGTDCISSNICGRSQYLVKLDDDDERGCIDESFSVNNQDINACRLGGLWPGYNRVPGEYSRPPEVEWCWICPVGYACSNGEKRQCNQGREYQDDSGQSECKICDNDFYIKGSEGGIRTICDRCYYAGFYRSGGFCIPCPVGNMCIGDGSKTECTGANYQNESGKSECETCPAGSYVDGNNCITCPIGYACPGNGEKNECTGDANYQDEPGKSECKTCPAGSYVDGNNCITCPIGYACPGDGGKDECIGRDDDTGGNFYQDQTGQSSCNVCGASYTVGSNANHSVNIRCNTCGAGYCTTSDEVCHKCSAGYACPATFRGVAQACRTDFIDQEEEGEYGVVMCSAGNYTSQEGGASSCESCLPGYTTACDTNSGDNCTNVECYNKEAGIGCYDDGNVCRKQSVKMCIGENCDFTWPAGLTIGYIDLSKIKKKKSNVFNWGFSFYENPF